MVTFMVSLIVIIVLFVLLFKILFSKPLIHKYSGDMINAYSQHSTSLHSNKDHKIIDPILHPEVIYDSISPVVMENNEAHAELLYKMEEISEFILINDEKENITNLTSDEYNIPEINGTISFVELIQQQRSEPEKIAKSL